MKKSYIVGGFYRGEFRRVCVRLFLDFKEDKGWIDSAFIVEGKSEDIEILDNWIRRNT
jgi:hypothetical protein